MNTASGTNAATSGSTAVCEALRCRFASNRQIPAATETFRLSTCPASGMRASTSHRSRVKRRRPAPSAPSAHASGPVKSSSNNDCSASPAVPTMRTSASRKSSIARARLVTGISGTVSAAPAAAFIAEVVNPAERSRGTMTALTPAASATRRHAPRLRGSVTPSSNSSMVFASTRFNMSSSVTACSSSAASATTP